MPRTQTTFYAIQHVPTGAFLPQSWASASGRSRSSCVGTAYTESEPSHEDPPRLFLAKGDATKALNAWLRGELVRLDDLDAPSKAIDVVLVGGIRHAVMPKPHRVEAHMAVVPMMVVQDLRARA